MLVQHVGLFPPNFRMVATSACASASVIILTSVETRAHREDENVSERAYPALASLKFDRIFSVE
jgi:hypothetical protein